MANIFIVGATGGVGKRLCPMLVAAGHQVTGLCRDDKHADWYQQNQVTRVTGDIASLSVDDLADMIQGADIIVFAAGAAGAGKNKTDAIDGQGPIKLSQAMIKSNIQRIYLISAFPESARTQNLGEGFEHYMYVKKETDAALVATDLDWVILRPGTLLDEEGDGAVSLGKALSYNSVKRGNVAKVLAQLIETPSIKRDILELTDGDLSVDIAVAKVANG